MRSFTGFDVTKKFKIINKKCGNSGRLLLLEIDIDDSLFVLINIYDANNEPDQIKTLHDLGEMIILLMVNQLLHSYSHN